MSRYVLTAEAQDDLVAIRDYYQDQAGYRVGRQMISEFVEAFRFIARTPGAGHVREDLSLELPILFWPMRDYLIIYRPEKKPVSIIAILRGSRDLPAIIRQRRL